MVRRWQRQLTLGVLLALTVLSLGLAPTVRAAASVTIYPSETLGYYEVQGVGFGHEELVRLTVTGPSQQSMILAEHTTAPSGTFDYVIQMPRHAEAGQWTVTLLGTDTGMTAASTLEMPYLGPDIELIVSYTGGPIGTTFGFTSASFASEELVNYWLTGPDGKLHLNGQLTATKLGRVSFGAAVVDPMPLGEWKMSAHGLRSDHLGIAAFTVGPVDSPLSGPAPISGPSVTVTTGATPGTFTLRATDFGRAEAVKMVAAGPGGQTIGLPSQTTEVGAFDYSFRLPRYAAAGRWTITLTGQDTGWTASASFDMPLLGPDVPLATAQQTGGIGTVFPFHGFGYESREMVTYWLVGPDGTTYTSGRVEATPLGRVSFSALISEGMPVGSWTAYAYGTSSDHLGVTTFTVI